MNLLKRNRIIFISMLFIAFIVLFIQYEHRAPKRNFSDFHVPYMTAKRLLNNEDIYTFKSGLSYYKYPAFYAFLMGPFSFLKERYAASLWYIFNLFFLCALFYVARKLIAAEDKTYNIPLLYSLTILTSFRFILQNLHEGQANIFMLTLLFCGLYFIVNGKENTGSFFLAFSIMTKYMPVFFLPYFLLQRRLKLILKIIVLVILFSFLPVFTIGLGRMLEVLKQQMAFLFPSSLDFYSISCYPNQSLLACLNRFFCASSPYTSRIFNLSKDAISIIFFVAAAVLYFFALYRPKRLSYKEAKQNNSLEKFYLKLDFSLICICMALFNPNAWLNFFVLLIFPHMFVIYYLLKTHFKDKVVTTLFVVSFLLNSIASEFFVQWWAGDTFEIYSSVTIGALFVFASLMKIKWSSVIRYT